MNNLTAIIVDDEQDGRQALSNFLLKYCPDVTLLGTAGSVSDAIVLIRATQPKLVFLDINMPHQNGFDLFRHFLEPAFQTIFVTAYDEYALKAIKHQALDYILKPINIDELINAVARARAKNDPHKTNENTQGLLHGFPEKTDRIALPVLDGFLYVPVHEIIRCEAESNYTSFHFTNRSKLLVSRTLGSFEAQLKPHGFIRVHHHHLINLRHVEKYQRGRGGIVFMSDKKEVLVSQRKRDEFLQLIGVIPPEE